MFISSEHVSSMNKSILFRNNPSPRGLPSRCSVSRLEQGNDHPPGAFPRALVLAPFHPLSYTGRMAHNKRAACGVSQREVRTSNRTNSRKLQIVIGGEKDAELFVEILEEIPTASMCIVP